MMKKSVAMLAVCMLAQSHLAIAAGTPAPQEINIVLLGTKGGPSLLNTARLPQATALTIGDKIWLIDAGYGASLQLVEKRHSTAQHQYYFAHPSAQRPHTGLSFLADECLGKWSERPYHTGVWPAGNPGDDEG